LKNEKTANLKGATNFYLQSKYTKKTWALSDEDTYDAGIKE